MILPDVRRYYRDPDVSAGHALDFRLAAIRLPPLVIFGGECIRPGIHNRVGHCGVRIR
jgi:hypothetical protein